MTSGGGLAGIDVANDDERNVNLILGQLLSYSPQNAQG